MSEHTPGPWFVVETEILGTCIRPNTDGGGIAKDGSYLSIYVYTSEDAARQASAHLIAAAPDMYAALKRQQDNIRRWLATGVPATEEESKQISDQIDAAIAKAEGRT
jgi:hypothetical protein